MVSAIIICAGKFQVRFLHPPFFSLWLFGLHKKFIAHGLHKPRFGALVGRSTLVLVTPVRIPNCASFFFELKHGIYMYIRLNTWLIVANILVAQGCVGVRTLVTSIRGTHLSITLQQSLQLCASYSVFNTYVAHVVIRKKAAQLGIRTGLTKTSVDHPTSAPNLGL